MQALISRKALETLWIEILLTNFPLLERPATKGHLKNDLGLDSMQLLDLAAEFHFRFDMLTGDETYYLLQYNYAQEWLSQILMAANDPNRRIGFFSSGSTGKAKQVHHQKKHLIAELDFWEKKFNPKRIFCLVPVRHIYGFIWGLLLGSRVGEAHFYSKENWQLVFNESNKDDLIIAHPAALQFFKHYFPHQSIINSTAALATHVETELVDLGFKGYNIYGSTETGAIGHREWLAEKYQMLPYWSINQKNITHLDTTYSLPDELLKCKDGQFEIGVRNDEVVQIGGQNVSLQAIRDKLAMLSGIKEVWVKPYQDQWGTRLFAHLQKQPSFDNKEIESQLKSLFTKLPAEMKPKQIKISEEAFSKLEAINIDS